MPKTRDLRELFRAIGSHDLGRATTVARDLAAEHGKRRQFQAERDLLAALNGAARPVNGGVAMSIGTGWNVRDALLALPSGRSLEALTLKKSVRGELAELLVERQVADKLQRVGLPRRWRLLFHGPPGCGKTATAAALASAAGLPAYLVRFDGLIGAYLGQTALRLREVFKFAEATPCVLIFDEIDALAKRRGNPTDVGELDRIVIAFLQELEYARSEGFLVASSNLPLSLDDALWRRFDLSIAFSKPAKAELARFAAARAREFGFRAPPSLIARCRQSPSFAQAEQLVVGEARRCLLSKLV